ncbi:mitochondrial genome maintenance exonuclease 1 [Antennarius striatus]|uniref:mitochondrial genome maintenance exonuclease 1 n=1 Tax=Antennarius striatus TaxID=241820 RepID=UPI0035ADD5A5
MVSFKRLGSFGSLIAPRCTALTANNFSAARWLRLPKRKSPYSSVDTERYSSLRKSVMSSRVVSQTPETLSVEDEHIYGPVVKAQTPSSGSDQRVCKTPHPFSHEEETLETEEPESGPPTRIALKRDPGRSSVPSVTRVLQQTLSPEQIFYLERWKRKMITELGEEGFKEYSQNLFQQGKLFHSALDNILTSGATLKNNVPDTPEYPPVVLGYLESISHVMEDISAVRAVESTVQHDTLNYLGVVDCVARYRGVLCVIDWKTSEKPKPFLGNTYDNPIQVAAYAGALNNDGKYKYQVENGLIVVAYKDGSPAHAHTMNSEQMLEYWKTWLVRFEEFTQKK